MTFRLHDGSPPNQITSEKSVVITGLVKTALFFICRVVLFACLNLPAVCFAFQSAAKIADSKHPDEVLGKVRQDEIARADKARADFAKYHPLGMDMELRARLSVVEKLPKLAYLLESLSTATKLKFSLDDNLRFHDPNLGNLQLNNVCAYSVMEVIAAHDLDDARWVKTDDGYRLEGTSRALRPPPQKLTWAWALAMIAAILLPTGAFVIYRRRLKKASTAQSGG